jgi:diguanylate cyclase (GGDEF)-like protein
MESEAQQLREERRSGLLRPIQVIGAVGVIAMALLTGVLLFQFDDSTRRAEESMVGHGFAQAIDENAAVVAPQTDWDDAVEHVANHFDPAWIDRNMAIYLHALNGVERMAIVDGDSRPVYAAVNGRRGPLAEAASLHSAVAGMMPDLRRREARRPTLRPDPEHARLVARPIQAGAITQIDGIPYIVVASLIQPDFGTALPVGPRAPVMITASPIDAAMLAHFARRYHLEGLHVRDSVAHSPSLARVPLIGAGGEIIAWLAWHDRAPAFGLMLRMILPLLFIFGVLGHYAQNSVRRSRAVASDLIVSEARARHLAYHDMLTQLPNRAMMFDRMRIALASARRRGGGLAIHCLDLDRFKDVNDTLGHHAGDELICKVAAMLTGLCRETDTVARLGGDEFVIIQPDTAASGALLLAERVLKAIKAPIELKHGVVEVGVSIGVTLVEAGSVEPSEALRQADLALYDAKENGRNRVTFFEPEMDAAVRMRHALDADLRKALHSGELTMVYQPQVDQSGTVTAMEALLRWTHPERGVIAPAVFIPLAEESGLILDLGEFVFRRVFEETRDWADVEIAINVSALQLRSPTFMSMLTQIIAEFRVDPARYEIEITETALLGEDTVTKNNIIMLKQEGFSIALDDFGTGYSSLSTLQRFAIDKIKIDRSFVRTLASDGEADALVEAIIRLGRALKLDVVAEGVETTDQRERLLSCGCSNFQGYLLSRPMAAEAATMMLA